MIHINNINISGVHSGLIDISAVYKGLQLVWSKLSDITSSYYNGYWVDEYPWDDNLYWRD